MTGNIDHSLDCLSWDKQCVSLRTELLSVADETKKNCLGILDSETESIPTSLSALSASQLYRQSAEPMSIDANTSLYPVKFVAASRGLKKEKSSSGSKDRFTNAVGEIVSLTTHQIQKRHRQLSIGKETVGYINYVRAVSKSKRCSWHPKTPNPLERISKRRFKGKVSVWRRKLHFWDVPSSNASPPSRQESKVYAEFAD